MEQIAQIEVDREQRLLRCCGLWTVQGLGDLNVETTAVPGTAKDTVTVDVAQIKKLDTAGAYQLCNLARYLANKKLQVSWQGFTPEQQALFDFVNEKSADLELSKGYSIPPVLEHIGRWAIDTAHLSKEFLAFVGETSIVLGLSLLNPMRLRWRALLSVVEAAGCRAIFIIGLLSFLIGMVLVYQMGLQLRNYGANVFVTDILGISLLREFSPLLTAIIVAGRTGSAFTAQIGTMKVNEEVDAIRTFGLSPTELLLLPRMLALIIVLPLLTVVSEIAGVFGGMIVSKTMLGIPYSEFLKRFQEVIELKTYVLGMIKVPIFAAIIATVGCFQGLKVTGSAESVGQRTTISVVHSIFLIIVADAIISVIYSWNGL